MRKRIIISITVGVLVLAAILAGFLVSGNPEDESVLQKEAAMADQWYVRADAEQTKSLPMRNSAELEEKEEKSTMRTDGAVKEAESSKELTYVITNGKDEENPLDIYEDEEKNEYRYNQDGNLDTYMQDLENVEIEIAEGESVTEEEAIALAWQYVRQLYGERVDGFQYVWSRLQSEATGYYVEFAAMYGQEAFVEGSGVLALVRMNGELGNSTINEIPAESFDLSKLKDLTKQEVYDEAVRLCEAQYSDVVDGSLKLSTVRLLKDETNEYQLSVVYTFAFTNGTEGKDAFYYECP